MIFPSCRHCTACSTVRRLCLTNVAYSPLTGLALAAFFVAFFFVVFFLVEDFFLPVFFELRFFDVFFLAVFFFAAFLPRRLSGAASIAAWQVFQLPCID